MILANETIEQVKNYFANKNILKNSILDLIKKYNWTTSSADNFAKLEFAGNSTGQVVYAIVFNSKIFHFDLNRNIWYSRVEEKTKVKTKKDDKFEKYEVKIFDYEL